MDDNYSLCHHENSVETIFMAKSQTGTSKKNSL